MTTINPVKWGWAIVVAFSGYVILKMIQVLVTRMLSGRLSDQIVMIIRKTVFYAGLVILVMIVFNQLGFQLTALLGAAGIAGIAIGFAAQTSVSNVISGIFLISENSFSVGDLLQVGETTGTVMAIDLLSVKIRTFDNRFVRIPNEVMIKSQLTNITRFPIRRVDLALGISYDMDIEKVRDILLDIARLNPYCLDEPEPIFIIEGFGSSSINIRLGVWCIREDYLNLKNSIIIAIKKRFNREKIVIPFPRVDIHHDAGTGSFPEKQNANYGGGTHHAGKRKKV